MSLEPLVSQEKWNGLKVSHVHEKSQTEVHPRKLKWKPNESHWKSINYDLKATSSSREHDMLLAYLSLEIERFNLGCKCRACKKKSPRRKPEKHRNKWNAKGPSEVTWLQLPSKVTSKSQQEVDMTGEWEMQVATKSWQKFNTQQDNYDLADLFYSFVPSSVNDKVCHSMVGQVNA